MANLKTRYLSALGLVVVCCGCTEKQHDRTTTQENKIVKGEEDKKHEALKTIPETNFDELNCLAIVRKMNDALRSTAGIEGEITVVYTFLKENAIEGIFRCHPDNKRYFLELRKKVDADQWEKHIISDGETIWEECVREKDGRRHVIFLSKSALISNERAGPTRNLLLAVTGGPLCGHPIKSMQDIVNMFDYKKVTVARLDDNDIWILDGNLTDDGAQAISHLPTNVKSIRVSISQSDGLVRKIELLSSKGETLDIMQISKIKSNVMFKDELFQYSPPEGRKVFDLDKGQ